MGGDWFFCHQSSRNVGAEKPEVAVGPVFELISFSLFLPSLLSLFFLPIYPSICLSFFLSFFLFFSAWKQRRRRGERERERERERNFHLPDWLLDEVNVFSPSQTPPPPPDTRPAYAIHGRRLEAPARPAGSPVWPLPRFRLFFSTLLSEGWWSFFFSPFSFFPFSGFIYLFFLRVALGGRGGSRRGCERKKTEKGNLIAFLS